MPLFELSEADAQLQLFVSMKINMQRQLTNHSMQKNKKRPIKITARKSVSNMSTPTKTGSVSFDQNINTSDRKQKQSSSVETCNEDFMSQTKV